MAGKAERTEKQGQKNETKKQSPPYPLSEHPHGARFFPGGPVGGRPKKSSMTLWSALRLVPLPAAAPAGRSAAAVAPPGRGDLEDRPAAAAAEGEAPLRAPLAAGEALFCPNPWPATEAAGGGADVLRDSDAAAGGEAPLRPDALPAAAAAAEGGPLRGIDDAAVPEGVAGALRGGPTLAEGVNDGPARDGGDAAPVLRGIAAGGGPALAAPPLGLTYSPPCARTALNAPALALGPPALALGPPALALGPSALALAPPTLAPGPPVLPLGTPGLPNGPPALPMGPPALPAGPPPLT